MNDQLLADTIALDLEHRLTVSAHIGEEGCDCSEYLTRRRMVLMREILSRSLVNGTDPVDDFAAFARRLHDRHPDKPVEPVEAAECKGSAHRAPNTVCPLCGVS